jgi:hypothetical protein
MTGEVPNSVTTSTPHTLLKGDGQSTSSQLSRWVHGFMPSSTAESVFWCAKPSRQLSAVNVRGRSMSTKTRGLDSRAPCPRLATPSQFKPAAMALPKQFYLDPRHFFSNGDTSRWVSSTKLYAGLACFELSCQRHYRDRSVHHALWLNFQAIAFQWNSYRILTVIDSG